MEANGPYFIVKGAEGKCDRAEAKQEVRKNIAAAAQCSGSLDEQPTVSAMCKRDKADEERTGDMENEKAMDRSPIWRTCLASRRTSTMQ